MTEINIESKTKFFAQYWGQLVIEDVTNSGLLSAYPILGSNMYRIQESHLLLKTLSSITDEDAIEVAKLAHQLPKGNFKVLRRDERGNIIYVETDFSSVGIKYFISIRYKYGTVCAQICFSETPTEKYSQNTVSIGQISISSERPVPYIAIVDFLRSKGYAIQFMGLSVEQMVEAGWIKLVV